MRFSERLGRGRVVAQMQIDRITPAIGARDRVDRPVDLTHTGLTRHDPNDRALRRCLGRVARTDIDMMDAAIDSIDQQEVPVAMLIGQAARHHLADYRPRFSLQRIV